MAVTEQDFDRARTRMETRREDGHATAARYDRKHARVVVDLDTGVQIAFPVARTEGLAGASASDLAEIEISPSGLGLHWPRLDADVYLPALLQGVFGSRRWMAAHFLTWTPNVSSRPRTLVRNCSRCTRAIWPSAPNS